MTTFNQAMFARDRTLSIKMGMYTAEQIKSANFSYGFQSGDSYTTGGTDSASGKIVLFGIIKTFHQLDKVYPQLALKVDSAYEWVPMGEFFVKDIKIDRNANITTLELMDGMFKLNAPYVTDLTYPAQIRDVICEIAAKTGIELATDSLGLKAIQDHINKRPEGQNLTFRSVLSQAIQILGYSAFFNREGKLEIRGLTESGLTITADNYYLHGLEKSEIEYQIAGVTCKQGQEKITVGVRTGRSLEIENSFMHQNLLNDFYHQIKDIRYYPYSLKFQGHLKLQVGQWVTIETNKGERYKVPVFSQKFDFTGGLSSQISADSTAKNDTQYSYGGFLTKKIEQMSTEIEAEVQQQIEYANQEIDKKFVENEKLITDGIEEAKSKAEVVKAEIVAGIEQKINDSKSELATQLHRDFERSLGAERAKLGQLEGNQTEARRLLDQHKQETTSKIEEAKASILRVQAEFNQSKQNWNGTVAELNRAKAELETVKGAQSTFKQSTEQNLAQLTNKVDGKVDQAMLNHTANEIKASVSTLRTGLDDKVSIAAFNLKSGQIETSVQALSNAKADKTLVTQTEDRLRERIESMQVGGRNLLRGTRDFSYQWTLFEDANWITDSASYRGLAVKKWVSGVKVSPYQAFTVEAGVEYTFSAYYKKSRSGRLYFYLDQEMRPSGYRKGVRRETILDTTSTEWTRFSLTFIPESNGEVRPRFAFVDDSELLVCGYKLERGNLATDWSPAPEDSEEAFTHFMNETTRTAQETRQELKSFNDSLSGRLTSAENQIRTTAEGINTQMTQLRQSGDTLSRKVATVEETAGGLTRRIEALQIGSVNLVRNSKINESSNAYGFGKRTVSLVAGKTYWFLARAKKIGGVADKMAKIYLYFPNWSHGVGLDFNSTEYEIKSAKFIPRTTGVHDLQSYWHPKGGDRAGQADIDWYMVVESDLPPTQWSPHPEDGEDFATRKLAEYKQTVDRNYAHLQTEINGKVSTSIFDQRVNEIRQSVTSLNNDALKKAEVTIGNGFVSFGAGKTINGTTLSSMMVAQPESIQAISRLFRITGDMLVDGTITGRDIAAHTISTGELKSGAVTTEILGANAVTSDKLKVDLALINKLTAEDAFFKVLTAKQAFITAVQSVDISATHVKSGLLTSRNGAARFNLDNGQLDFFHNAPSINFNSDTAALRRVHSGLPNQFIKFTSSDGRTGCTVIGSNRGGNEDVNNDQFVGLRIFNGGVDKIDIIGDTVRLASSPSVRADGWVFNTLPNQMKIHPYLQSDYPSSRLTIGDVNLYTSSSRGYSLLDVLRKFDIMFAHLGNHTGRHDVFRKVGI